MVFAQECGGSPAPNDTQLNLEHMVGKTKARNRIEMGKFGGLTVGPVVSCPDTAPKIEAIGEGMAGALEMCMPKKSFRESF